MHVDLKDRPKWKEIAAATEVVGSRAQIEEIFLKAIDFASTQKPSGPGELSVYEQAALNLAGALNPSRAYYLAHSKATQLKNDRAYRPAPNLDVVELCAKECLERRRQLLEASQGMARATAAQPSEFGAKIQQAVDRPL